MERSGALVWFAQRLCFGIIIGPMPVYGNTDINDIRTAPQFRGYSFSKFKKTEVKNQMVENMRKAKVEPAIYWCAELVCAGHYLDVWEIIMSFS